MTTFDVTKFMMNIRGKQYLPVAPRIVMMRKETEGWRIVTEPVMFGDIPLVKATIYDSDGIIVSNAHKTVTSFQGGDVEKAETGAIGRALSIAGFGTIQAGDMDEGEQIADSPVEQTNGRPPQPAADPKPDITDYTTARDYPSFNRAYAQQSGYFTGPEHVFSTIRKLYGSIPRFLDVKTELPELLDNYAQGEGQ